jgi:hypothetical protein
MTVGDLDHLDEQLQSMPTEKAWRLFEALQEQHRGKGGIHAAELVRRHLNQREPAGEHPLTPEREGIAWELDPLDLEDEDMDRLADLVRSLPRVRGLAVLRGVPTGVYAPAGVDLGRLLRDEYPALGVWPLPSFKVRLAYSRTGGPARYARGDGAVRW